MTDSSTGAALSDPLIPKDRLLGLSPNSIYLASGGESPLVAAAPNALSRYAEVKAAGDPGRAAMVQLAQQARSKLSELLGIDDPQQVSFVASASEAMNAVARDVSWRSGDEIVVLEREFPSVVMPWLALRDRGVVVKRISRELLADPESAILAALTSRTKLVAVSHVSYWDGFRLDLKRIANAAHDREAMLVVDCSHSLGVLPIDASSCDVLVSCSHKFLLGPHGLGILYWNPQRFRPKATLTSPGWNSATLVSSAAGLSYVGRDRAPRYESGNPPFLAIAVLSVGLDLLLDVGIERLEAYVTPLVGAMHEGLRNLGVHLVTPDEPLARGTSVAFLHEEPGRIMAELAERGVLVWGGEGRVRLSIHGFNDGRDVTEALERLSQLLPESARRRQPTESESK